LIVSLTSYPPRFATLPYTLRSLLQQTVRADLVVLWIAHDDTPRLPKAVLRLQKAGLEIRATNDLKSYKKIILALDAFPDPFICTADDEVYYWPTWLEELVRSACPRDRVISCHRPRDHPHRARRFRVASAMELQHTPSRAIKEHLSHRCRRYPLPARRTHPLASRPGRTDLLPHNDDIWLYWMGRSNGAAYQTVDQPQPRDLVTWDGSQKCALAFYDVVQSSNDTQIEKIAALFTDTRTCDALPFIIQGESNSAVFFEFPRDRQ
jgi:hypothetical protein